MDVNVLKSPPHLEIPPSLKASKYTLVEVVLLVVVIGLSYWFIVQPKSGSLKEKKAQVAQLQKEQSLVASNLSDLQRMINELKSHPKDVAVLDEALPLDGKILRLNMLIEALAGSAGVTVADINISEKGDAVVAGNQELLADPFAPKRALQKLPGAIAVSGTYDQLTTFLKKIESNIRIMNIKSLDIAGQEDNQLGLKIEIEAYYYAQ